MKNPRKTTYPPFNLDIPKMGDTLALRTDGSFFAVGIEIKQRKSGFSPENARYIHLEILGGGPRSMQISPPRARVIDITKEYAGRYIKILRPVDPDWDRKRKHVAWINATLCNTKYDRRGIMRFLEIFKKWIKHHISRWFCSEGWLFSIHTECPDILPDLKPEDCVPSHVFTTSKMKIIWEGYMPKKI